MLSPFLLSYELGIAAVVISTAIAVLSTFAAGFFLAHFTISGIVAAVVVSTIVIAATIAVLTAF